MPLKLSRSDLVTALEAVKGAVADKGIVAILTHVLVDDDSIVAYDSAIGIRAKLGAPAGGTFNVKFDHLYELVKRLEVEDLEFVVAGKKVSIVAGKHRSTLHQLEEEFPIPQVQVTDWRMVPAGLKEAVERALMAASKDEARKQFCSICVGGDYVYGMDGNMLVRCKVEGLGSKPFLLPRYAAQELVRLGNPRRIGTDDSGAFAVFDYGTLKFVALLQEGLDLYPRVMIDNLLVSRAPAPVPLPDGLGSALNRLLIFAGKEAPAVTAEWGALGMTLSTQGDVNSCDEMLPAPASEFDKKMFSPSRLLSALAYADSIDWGKELHTPLYCRGAVAGFEFCLSPMRIGGA